MSIAADQLPFADRRAAGRLLAAALAHHRRTDDVLVLALPRGGVPVGYEVARALGAELDVLVVRKIGMPGEPEVAIGAIASGGVQVMDAHASSHQPEVQAVLRREAEELARRERVFRGDLPPPRIEGRTVLVVDDGLATGSTMEAALRALRRRQPQHLAMAVPVGPRATCARLRRLADEVVCGAMPEPFRAVGLWYRDFEQCGDDEVCSLLEAARHAQAALHP